jgi:2'-5' RNA ligase
VQRLAAEAQKALHPDAPVDLVPLPWLHLSLAEVGYVGDVPADTARQHARAAQRALAGIGPVTLTVGPVSAMPGAMVLDVHAAKLDDVHERLLSTLAHTVPRPAVQRPFVPHISIAYVRRHCTTEDVLVRAATTSGHGHTDSTASTEMSEIALVEVVRDLQHYRWTTSCAVGLD